MPDFFNTIFNLIHLPSYISTLKCTRGIFIHHFSGKVHCEYSQEMLLGIENMVVKGFGNSWSPVLMTMNTEEKVQNKILKCQPFFSFLFFF